MTNQVFLVVLGLSSYTEKVKLSAPKRGKRSQARKRLITPSNINVMPQSIIWLLIIDFFFIDA